MKPRVILTPMWETALQRVLGEAMTNRGERPHPEEALQRVLGEAMTNRGERPHPEESGAEPGVRSSKEDLAPEQGSCPL